MTAIERTFFEASRGKCGFMLFLALLFVFLGYGMLERYFWLGIACISFFGAAAVVPFIYIIDPARYSINASPLDLKVRTLFRSSSVSWPDIDYFFVGQVRSTKLVSIAYVAKASRRERFSLISLYRGSAEYIVKSLNDYKMHVLPLSKSTQQGIQPDSPASGGSAS